MSRPFHKKLKVVRGYSSIECPWKVEMFNQGWDSVAEFWDRTDAFIFVKAKRKLIAKLRKSQTKRKGK